MKYILLTLCFIAVEVFGQDYIAHEIYVKLKSVTMMKSCNSSNDTADLVEFKSSLSMNTLQEDKIEHVKASFHFCSSTDLKKTFTVKVSPTADIDDLLSDLNNDPNVEYAERIPEMQKSAVPDDLGENSYDGQWALHKIGAKDAWDISKGNPEIVVAVVDNAIDTDHEDLKDVCLKGRDVADGDSDTRPVSNCHSHGTHVAGIVGATTNNNKGFASIGYGISILPVKATSDTNRNCRSVPEGFTGVSWAANNGANIINMSWGGSASSNTHKQVIDDAHEKGIILIASAGNDDSLLFNFPAAYENVISVAATDVLDRKASFSNYGPRIDVAAPGVIINSTNPFDSYGQRSGTSMAAPLVAGLCGLVWSADLSQSAQSVIDCVLNTSDNIDDSNPDFGKFLGAGRINAYEALFCASPFHICTFNDIRREPVEDFLVQRVQLGIIGEENNVIQPGANVTYDAGDYILLRPGFKALEGSRFHGFIDGCEVLSKTASSDDVVFVNNNDLALNIHPNPVNQLANITYQLQNEDRVTITLFDATGKHIATLTKNQLQEEGNHLLSLDAANLLTGIYYLKLQSNKNNIIKKLMIAK